MRDRSKKEWFRLRHWRNSPVWTYAAVPVLQCVRSSQVIKAYQGML